MMRQVQNLEPVVGRSYKINDFAYYFCGYRAQLALRQAYQQREVIECDFNTEWALKTPHWVGEHLLLRLTKSCLLLDRRLPYIILGMWMKGWGEMCIVYVESQADYCTPPTDSPFWPGRASTLLNQSGFLTTVCNKDCLWRLMGK